MADADKEPVAGLTAASACIRLSLCSESEVLTFRPVFTHQCFPDECLPGWRPLIEAEHQARSIYGSWKRDENTGHDLHPSFAKCRLDGVVTGRIDIHVKLTPACTACEVEIQTIECDDDKVDEPASKKVKTVRFEQSDDRGLQPLQRMSIDDILKQMSKALPPIACVRLNDAEYSSSDVPIQNNASIEDSQYLDQPLGTMGEHYARKIKETSEESDFLVTIARGTDDGVSQYHSSVQKMARWFIETADDVDLSGKSEGGDEGGFWGVIYLFRQHNVADNTSADGLPKIRYSLAGYITLFYFHAPFKKPEPGIVMRICQALILPPYQRAGHGTSLMKEIYKHADQCIDGIKIVEVNVEDPAPAFVALRDSHDYGRYRDLIAAGDSKKQLVQDDDFFVPLSDGEHLEDLALKMKVTKRQVQIAEEIYRLSQLEQWRKDCADISLFAEKETKYRLMVKKSLRALHMEELGACSGKEEMKALLEKWFQDTLAHYKSILGIQS